MAIGMKRHDSQHRKVFSMVDINHDGHINRSDGHSIESVLGTLTGIGCNQHQLFSGNYYEH